MDIDAPMPYHGPAQERFRTLSDLMARFEGKPENFVCDALVAGFSPSCGFVFVPETARFLNEIELPADLCFIAKLEVVGRQIWAYDQDMSRFPGGELITAIQESLPDMPQGKIYHLAWISTGANKGDCGVFCDSAKAHKPRRVSLRRSGEKFDGPIFVKVFDVYTDLEPWTPKKG